MDSKSSSAQIDPPRDAVPLTAPDRWTGVEDALSRLAERAARETPDPELATAPNGSAVSQAPEPSVLATVRPAEFRNAPLASETPSRRSRAARAFAGFVMAVCVGVAGILTWQSYGGAAREMIASRTPRLAWAFSRSPAEQTPAPGTTASGPALPAAAVQPAAAQPATVAQAAAGTPQPTASQVAPIAATAVNPAPASPTAPAVPAAPSPDRQQLDGMVRDIGALRQEVEQLTARQEQMARDMAKLRATKASSHRVLGAPPHPLGVLVSRPPTAPPAAPQVSSAPPVHSYPQPAPQMLPPPAPSPQSLVTSQSLRPPAPVPER